jgi:hypothetical protein
MLIWRRVEGVARSPGRGSWTLTARSVDCASGVSMAPNGSCRRRGGPRQRSRWRPIWVLARCSPHDARGMDRSLVLTHLLSAGPLAASRGEHSGLVQRSCSPHERSEGVQRRPRVSGAGLGPRKGAPGGRWTWSGPSLTRRTLGTSGPCAYRADVGHQRTPCSPGGRSAPADPVLTGRTFGTSGPCAHPGNVRHQRTARLPGQSWAYPALATLRVAGRLPVGRRDRRCPPCSPAARFASRPLPRPPTRARGRPPHLARRRGLAASRTLPRPRPPSAREPRHLADPSVHRPPAHAR